MKKGFTLIELLAVIVILAIILVVAIPKILKTIGDTKDATYKAQKNLIISSAEKYCTQNNDLTFINNQAVITLKELQDSGYIAKNIKDSRTGIIIPDTSWVLVTNNSGQYSYSYGYETEGLVLHYDGMYNGGLRIHNDNASVNKALWKDLSGTLEDGVLTNFNYTSSSGWLNNGLKFDGINDFLISNNFTNLSIFTAQVVLDIPTATTGAKTYIAFNNYTQGTWQGSTQFSWWKSADFFWSFGRTNTKQLHTLVINVPNLSVMLKVNNNTSETITVPSANLSSIYNVSLSNLAGGNYNDFTYHSVRIYNRALTEQEILNNYEVDKIRFGL